MSAHETLKTEQSSTDLRSPPKANIGSILGLMRESKKDLLHFFDGAANGEKLVQLPNPSARLYLVNDADFVKKILITNHQNYPKSDYYDRLRPVFGNGLFELEGREWKQKRKALNPAFSKRHHADFLELAIQAAQRTTADVITEGTKIEIDIAPFFMKGTLEFIVEALCSERPDIDFEEFSEALTTIMKVGEELLWATLPTIKFKILKRNLKFKKAIQTFDEVLLGLLNTRKDKPNDGKMDLLDMILGQKDSQTGESINLQQMRDDLLTVLVAGHETTALAVSWALYALGSNPILRSELESEADQIDLTNVSLSDLKNLNISRSISLEALRLFPPLWSMSRKAIKDDVLGDFHIPAGTNLMISPHIIHRNKDYWPNPTSFDPRRFFSDKPEPREGTYLPFGAGPRVCVGKHLALMELQVFLLTIAKSCRCDLSVSCKVEKEPMISLRPKNGLVMNVTTR